MREYTTPTVTMQIPGVALSGATVHITFSGTDGNVILDTAPTTVEDTEGMATVTLNMTQEQTALFDARKFYLVQINWIIDSKRYATNVVKFRAKTNLLKEVLS